MDVEIVGGPRDGETLVVPHTIGDYINFPEPLDPREMYVESMDIAEVRPLTAKYRTCRIEVRKSDMRRIVRWYEGDIRG